KTTKAVTEAGLDRLSTFGLLSTWPKADLMALLDSFLRADLVRTTLDVYPKLSLTESGAEILRGAPLRLDFQAPKPSSASKKTSKAPVQLSDASRALFERLRAWRSERARADGVPAYVVASDRVLGAVAEERPGTPEALLAISGVGPTKVERYGSELLGLIADGK
ncbi:MAG: HRDC domain-containing protein, partial [Myxococcota bacterium]